MIENLGNQDKVRCYFAAVHAPDWLDLKVPEWDAVAECGIAGIDIRIANPHSGPSQHERKLAKLVQASGLEVRVHGWVGRSDTEGFAVANHRSGLADGEVMGSAGAELGATFVGMNAEKAVWRWRGGKANPHADDFYRGFHEGSLKAYPTGRLQDVGFADPREHYDPKADLDGDGVPDALITRETAELSDRRGVMAYQSSAVTVQRKLARGRAIAGPALPISWWGGVGRPSPTEGVVGNYQVTLEGCRERWSGIDEWVGYVGFTERGQKLPTIKMLTVGHEAHPPLVQLVRAICGKVT